MAFIRDWNEEIESMNLEQLLSIREGLEIAIKWDMLRTNFGGLDIVLSLLREEITKRHIETVKELEGRG